MRYINGYFKKFKRRGLAFLVIVVLCLSYFFILGQDKPSGSLSASNSNSDNLRINLVYLIPVFIGLLLLAVDILLRRYIQKADLEFRKMQYNEGHEAREEQRKWLNEQSLKLSQVSNILSQDIAQDLKKDFTWAVEALEKAKIGLQARTIFGERMEHFRDEKESIADQFLPKLLDRCAELVEKKKDVYILIDSGTTLYPLFKKIGAEAVRAYANKEEWISNVTIITNNLIGVEALMEVGRINPNDRYSPLAIECRLLPGKPLPIYLAVTGDMTEDALRGLRNRANENGNSFFIGITTGNWIRLRRSNPACPVPLARWPGHLTFKQTLIDNSDETYVVTPLGKIFVKNALEDVNKALGFEHNKSTQDMQEYSEVQIDNEKAKTVFLVSTCRYEGRVLSTLSTFVQASLGVDYVRSAEINAPGHLLFPFDKLNANWYLQIEQEFPHAKTRIPEFYEKYFFVGERPSSSKGK